MRNKLAIVVSVALLAAVALGGVAVASAQGRGDSGASSIQDRVAEILGITPDNLSSAVAQARSEAMQQRMADRLAAAVADSVITQDEADAITAWFEGKPDALSNIGHKGLRHAVHGDTVGEFLAGLVNEKIITQADSDEIAAWLGTRPEAIQQLRPSHGFRDGGHFFRGHGFRRGFGRFHRGFGYPAPSDGGEDSTDTSINFGDSA